MSFFEIWFLMIVKLSFDYDVNGHFLVQTFGLFYFRKDLHPFIISPLVPELPPPRPVWNR